jgi:hypothetical protein
MMVQASIFQIAGGPGAKLLTRRRWAIPGKVMKFKNFFYMRLIRLRHIVLVIIEHVTDCRELTPVVECVPEMRKNDDYGRTRLRNALKFLQSFYGIRGVLKSVRCQNEVVSVVLESIEVSTFTDEVKSRWFFRMIHECLAFRTATLP